MEASVTPRRLYLHGNMEETSPIDIAAPNIPEEQPHPAVDSREMAGDTTIRKCCRDTWAIFDPRYKSIPTF
jgi:hypothetical protein